MNGSGKPGPLLLNPLSGEHTLPPNLSEQPDHFEDFWASYPKRVGKGTARKAWAAALKRGANPQTVISAAGRHADAWKRADTDRQYIPYPATWLNGERYDDEQLPTAPQPPPTSATGHQTQPYKRPLF